LPIELTSPSVHISPEEADDSTVRRSRGPDLLKVLDEAQQLAADGLGIIPREVEPIPPDSTARRQFSFSRLNGQLIRTDPTDRNDDTSPPAFTPANSLDPRSLGTLVHDLLARVDLSDTNGIREWAEHLAPAHVIQNAAEAAVTAAELVSRFVASALVARAELVEREIEFIMAWPPDGTSGTYLRGYIDCLYRDPERGLVLLDYKTDDVAPANVAQYAERYAMQLYVYAMAVERALGQSPDELVLHFLRPGVDYVFKWNDANRLAARDMVNNAISSQGRME
jgi:ATP-dependent helicase/nuclease subunit A